MQTPPYFRAVTRLVVVLALTALGVFAYRTYGWPGIALAVGAVLMWALLHMSRMLLVLRRTARWPVGTVASAVTLHARLERGMPLLHVLALAQALGERVGAGDSEQYQWRDNSRADGALHVCGGKLTHWELLRT